MSIKNDSLGLQRPTVSELHDLKRRLRFGTATTIPAQIVVHADEKLDHPIRISPVTASVAEQAMHLRDGHPLDGFLIGFDHAAFERGEEAFYRFVGPDEHADLVDEVSSFLTYPEKELALLLGHPVLRHSNGHPIFSDAEKKLFEASLAVRVGVVENPHLSAFEKHRVLTSLGLHRFGKVIGSEFIAGGTKRVRFLKSTDGATVDLPEAAIDALLGRSVAATEGKLSDDEAEFLGLAFAAYEDVIEYGERGKVIDVTPTVHMARTTHGPAAAKRLSRFLQDTISGRIDSKKGEIVEIDKQLRAIRELRAWAEKGFVLERADGSKFHNLREALRTRSVIALTTSRRQPETLVDAFADTGGSFVIEHDWAKAFAGAGEFDTGEVALPFERSFWEFQVSGRRLGLAISGPKASVILMIQVSDGWVCSGVFEFSTVGGSKCRPVGDSLAYDNTLGRAFQGLTDVLLANVRAVSISLEAEVTETEVVRADYKLNQARERRGKLPLYDYHVVSLVRRSRAAALPAVELDPDREIVRRQCHFRRGHWRHYQAHKTWIKWMLVGDPDLGFVDKHYRL